MNKKENEPEIRTFSCKEFELVIQICFKKQKPVIDALVNTFGEEIIKLNKKDKG